MITNSDLNTRLNQGEIILLDGGTGTELERLGASMDYEAWCAMALETHPHLVKEVHRSYIEAGADVITVNSYACTKKGLHNAKMEDKFKNWNKLAVQLAKEIVAECKPERSIYLAGSVSTYGCTPRFSNSGKMENDQLKLWFRDQAVLLVESGIDLLLLETLAAGSTTILTAIEAVAEFNLPIWVAVSCALDRRSGELSLGVAESPESHRQVDHVHVYEPFHTAMEKVIAQDGFSALLMMHSEIGTTKAAVEILHRQYTGPVGAYPNAGYWQRPEWVFVDQISPDDYVNKASTWVAEGAQIIGGCCGIGPEHIRALRHQYQPN